MRQKPYFRDFYLIVDELERQNLRISEEFLDLLKNLRNRDPETSDIALGKLLSNADHHADDIFRVFGILPIDVQDPNDEGFWWIKFALLDAIWLMNDRENRKRAVTEIIEGIRVAHKGSRDMVIRYLSYKLAKPDQRERARFILRSMLDVQLNSEAETHDLHQQIYALLESKDIEQE